MPPTSSRHLRRLRQDAEAERRQQRFRDINGAGAHLRMAFTISFFAAGIPMFITNSPGISLNNVPGYVTGLFLVFAGLLLGLGEWKILRYMVGCPSRVDRFMRTWVGTIDSFDKDLRDFVLKDASPETKMDVAVAGWMAGSRLMLNSPWLVPALILVAVAAPVVIRAFL